MSESDFQDEVLRSLGSIETQLAQGAKTMDDHEKRIRELDRYQTEMKGRVVVIAAGIAAAFSIFCVWLGKHL